ncbi:hypothetical protein P152DRAFT_483858 [Eremomyces bilateralis CBS 781.70]|uniref:Uncharacterized protein n=1 Tax=Eremomyces bilateralis CBS 781.70 TaxID=1392243 RepID=A0A6G1FXF5_9PEZI|nr:uncharacterized protein P152DRAFT_483858 [Eremomyces bilateralis CBS 781.70]KAF1810392.1 hypothetical protein P152DRAFT_483858 [Eremomyces bilateralis CBS 781.70]
MPPRGPRRHGNDLAVLVRSVPTLKTRRDWCPWMKAIETHARRVHVWDYINPDGDISPPEATFPTEDAYKAMSQFAKKKLEIDREAARVYLRPTDSLRDILKKLSSRFKPSEWQEKKFLRESHDQLLRGPKKNGPVGLANWMVQWSDFHENAKETGMTYFSDDYNLAADLIEACDLAGFKSFATCGRGRLFSADTEEERKELKFSDFIDLFCFVSNEEIVR